MQTFNKFVVIFKKDRLNLVCNSIYAAPCTGCFISICHFMINYISITVKDMKTKLFLLKTNVLNFTQQKFESKNQRNKHFIKLFTNVQYASPWLHSTHQNGILFHAKHAKLAISILCQIMIFYI